MGPTPWGTNLGSDFSSAEVANCTYPGGVVVRVVWVKHLAQSYEAKGNASGYY